MMVLPSISPPPFNTPAPESTYENLPRNTPWYYFDYSNIEWTGTLSFFIPEGVADLVYISMCISPAEGPPNPFSYFFAWDRGTVEVDMEKKVIGIWWTTRICCIEWILAPEKRWLNCCFAKAFSQPFWVNSNKTKSAFPLFCCLCSRDTLDLTPKTQPCLACTSCNKRLDSYTLLEHDQQVRLRASHFTFVLVPDRIPSAQPYWYVQTRACLLYILSSRRTRP